MHGSEHKSISERVTEMASDKWGQCARDIFDHTNDQPIYIRSSFLFCHIHFVSTISVKQIVSGQEKIDAKQKAQNRFR